MGVFLGILPGSGPIASLFLALLFRLNRASALLGSLVTNTWLSIVTFLLAVKAGALALGLDWRAVYLSMSIAAGNFHFRDLLKASFLKLIFPLVVGYLIVSLFFGICAYLAVFVIIKTYKKRIKRGRPEKNVPSV